MTLQNLQLKELHENVYVRVSAHTDNMNTVLTIHDVETDEIIITPTVQVPELILPEIVFIKDYGENEGVFDWLVANKIIEPDTDLDYIAEEGIERGGIIIDKSILHDIQRQCTKWEEEYLVPIQFFDENENPLLENDDVTPVTMKIHKNEMKKIEQVAQEKNLSLLDAIIDYLETIKESKEHKLTTQ